MTPELNPHRYLIFSEHCVPLDPNMLRDDKYQFCNIYKYVWHIQTLNRIYYDKELNELIVKLEDRCTIDLDYLVKQLEYGIEYLNSLGNDKAKNISKMLKRSLDQKSMVSLSEEHKFNLENYEPSMGVVRIKKLNEITHNFIRNNPC